jgi:hypothetical protein
MTEVPLVDTERLLEDWVELDPSILGDGYVVVGRQVNFDGGPADLIAVDPQGRWVLIEIKRASNHRQDVAQALDYASSLRKEPSDQLRARLTRALTGKPYQTEALERIATALADDDEGTRDVAILLLGVGTQSGAERIQGFLQDHGIDVRIVSLVANRDPEGRFVLWRDDTIEQESAFSPQEAHSREDALEAIRSKAREFGVLEPFDRWLDLCQAAGLNVRPYKHSVMITPPNHNNTYLMVGRPLSSGSLRLNHGMERFHEWFTWIPEIDAQKMLGASPRGPGIARSGTELDEYLDGVQTFLHTYFPPPEGFSMGGTTQKWTRSAFLEAFDSTPLEKEFVTIALDRAEQIGRIDYGSGAVGQAHLAFTSTGPQILQISTGGRVRGMWSLGRIPADNPCWQELQKMLAKYGGFTHDGRAPSIPISDFHEAQWRQLVEIAVNTAGCFTQ